MTATLVRYPDTHAADGDPDTLLAAGISSSDLTILFTTEPPALASYVSGQFAILIRTPGGGSEEWVLIDSYNGSLVATVNASGRGYAGSTAASHATNDEILFAVLEEDFVRAVDGRNINPLTVKVNAELGYDGDAIDDVSISANTDNLDLDGLSVARITTDASRNLTGIVAPSPEYARRLIIENVGSFDLVLKDDVTSTAANRFQFTGDVTLTPMQHVELLYDTTLDRWVMLGAVGGGITSHTHESAGAQGGTLDEDALALTDVTTNNVSTTKHGFAPKAPNDATKYLDGTGAYTVPTASGIPGTIVDAKGDLIVATAADTVARLAVGSNGQVLTADSGETTGLKWAAAGGGASIAYLHYQDQKAQNTASGTFTQGAYRTRTLNTEVVDSGNHGSLASDQITLAGGTYIVHARCPAYQVGRHQARLYNITGSAVLLLGNSAIAWPGTVDSSDSTILGVIVLGGSTVVELQHWCASTFATQGFGIEANIATEIYAEILLTKIA